MLPLLLQVFRLVPFRALYWISNGLAFLLSNIVGYRKKVIRENLRRAFPEKSDAELRQIIKATYRNLTDVTLETMKLFTLPYAELERRCKCVNPELVDQFLERGQCVMLSSSHIGNWEYAALTMAPKFKGTLVSVYKPLSNKRFDAFLNRSRSRTGMELVAMDQVFRSMRSWTNKGGAVFFMLADQSPSSRKSAHWVEFLNQDSASLPGVDVLSRKFQMPVLYSLVRRTERRGFYELEFSILYEHPGQAAEMDITRAYARRVEADIRAQPEQWLWSHRRWKMKRV